MIYPVSFAQKTDVHNSLPIAGMELESEHEGTRIGVSTGIRRVWLDALRMARSDPGRSRGTKPVDECRTPD